MTLTSHAFSPAEADAYERDGYVVRRGVFSAADVADMAEHCEVLVAKLVADRQSHRLRAGSYVFDPDLANCTIIKWEGDTDVVHGIEPFAHLSKPLADWADDERFRGPMTSILGTDDPALFTEKLNLKRPHIGGANPLHQDYPYWTEVADDATEVATIIVFLDDATLENGCLWVVPGSHKDGPADRRDGVDEFSSNELVDQAAEEAAVPVEASAGDVVMFGSYLLHRSAPNNSDKGRRALLFSYQPPGRRIQLDSMRLMAKQFGQEPRY